MSAPLTARIAELMLAGETGTVKHFATLLDHPPNNLSSILRGMVRRGAVKIAATGRGRNGSTYAAGDEVQLKGRVNGSVRRGTRPAKGVTTKLDAAIVTAQDCAFFISTDWSIQIVDPQHPETPTYLTQREWRGDLLPFLQRLDAALDPL